MTIVLRLNEDRLPAGGAPVYLPAIERSVYLLEGDVTVECASGLHQTVIGNHLVGL
jgi:hypothetical protein